MTGGEAGAVAVTGSQVRGAAAALGLSPAALATALVDPSLRLLVGEGAAALLRREWTPEGGAEAVLVHRRGIGTDAPAVLATAAGWGCDTVRAGDVVRRVPAPPDGAPLDERFRHLAARAATRVEVAVALARDAGQDTTKADGSPSLGAD